MTQYIAAIDQGTTSTRCMIFNHAGEHLANDQLEHTQVFPQAGWVEHAPLEIWERTRDVIHGAMKKAQLGATDIAAIGITNQRETTVVWDRHTGIPYYNAIVWQDTRTDQLCRTLAEGHGQDRFRARTGLPLAPYFSGVKLKWLLDNVPGLRAAALRGDALFGNMDSWIIWKLTGGPEPGAAHVTDVTNASRTQLMNLQTLDWDDSILDILGIPRAMLPLIRPSSAPTLYGFTRADGPFGGEVPICGDLGDQQAALEASAYQTRELLDAMSADAGLPIKRLKVDGGMTGNNLLLQIQADVLGVPVIRPKVSESTALGAAYAAGLAIGYWQDTDELRRHWSVDKVWEPSEDDRLRTSHYQMWKKAVTRTFDWLERA